MALKIDAPIECTLDVPIAAGIVGISIDRAYRKISEGNWPVLPGSGRRRVVTAKLELLIGRRIDQADIEAARAKVAPLVARKAEARRRSREKAAKRNVPA